MATQTDYQLILHAHQYHEVNGLAKSPDAMTMSVLQTLWDAHTSWHQVTNQSHDHQWLEAEGSMAKGWTGVTFRKEADGLDNRTNVWLFACPVEDCYLTVSGKDEATVTAHRDNHNCPQAGPAHFGEYMTLSMIEEVWVRADREYDKLIDADPPLDGDRLQQQRGILKGLCLAIAVFMSPRYDDTQKVAEEVRKRKTMRDAGQPYTSPGLAQRQFEFPTAATQAVEEEKMTPKARAEKILTEQERAGIKHAHDSMPTVFTVDVLAKQYHCTEAVVREVIG